MLGVFTSDDVDLAPLPPSPMFNAAMTRPMLADGVVRFVGEPVAVIVSERPEQGADAAEQVWIDYEPLPVVVDPRAAAKDEVILHEAAGTNIVLDLTFGQDPNLFDGCEVVVTQELGNQRVAAVPLECRAGAAAWVDGRLWQWSSTQHAHGVRDALALHVRARRGRRARRGPRRRAVASAPRSAAPPRSCCSAGWPGGSDVRCAGTRPAPRT